ncbi:hypothetical protein [Planctellipticum variicoloris]|uniref:hypothetical protein n=1 Tax=Planctellipticum variicoloris TaxID=3064265 RepID=UPI003013D774|nr:hypothetical protein SH412_002297 [Planctomycetaceae bacterium SH412]
MKTGNESFDQMPSTVPPLIDDGIRRTDLVLAQVFQCSPRDFQNFLVRGIGQPRDAVDFLNGGQTAVMREMRRNWLPETPLANGSPVCRREGISCCAKQQPADRSVVDATIDDDSQNFERLGLTARREIRLNAPDGESPADKCRCTEEERQTPDYATSSPGAFSGRV